MFCADIIGPLVKRVMRALGIREGNDWKPLWDTQGQSIPFDSGSFESMGSEIPTGIAELSNGDTCKVIWDGVAYVCPATVTDDDSAIEFGIGDADGTDEAIPFFFIFRRYHDTSYGCDITIWADTEEPAHSFEIYKQTTVTTPISDKYLPGVCLPVVELETVASPDGIKVVLTEEDSAKMDALDGGLCILCLSISGEVTVKECAITALDATDSLKVYSASTVLSDITVSNVGGHWTVVYTPKEV